MMSKRTGLTMNRRTFISSSAAAAGATSLFYPSNACGQAKKGVPNIIFIHVDQLCISDTISAYGSKYVNTPAIDRIIRNGTSFMQQYATDPVCCPARTSWFSGTWSSENGVVVNNTSCHRDTPDLSPQLQRAGYNTYFVGKWHVPGKDIRSLFHVLHEGSWWGEMTDRDVTRSTCEFLRNYNDRKPFFLSVGYLNPHDICITPMIDYFRSKRENGKLVPPYLKEGVLQDKDLPPMPEGHGYDKREPTIQVAQSRVTMDQPKFSEWSDTLWRMHRYNYFRFIEMVDEEIDLVLTELERSPWRDNTLIVFTSDHGDGMGRHLSVGKSTFYDEVVRTPFVIATLGDLLPVKKDVKDSEHLISGMDFGKTVCDYAGADGSKLPHGESVRLLAEGKNVSEWRDWVYSENSAYMHMICNGKMKYVRGYEEPGEVTGLPPTYKTHPAGVEQLFDLEKDPYEQHNLAYDRTSQKRLKELREIMNREEDKLLPLRPVTQAIGLNFMKTQTERIRKSEYPKTYPVQ